MLRFFLSYNISGQWCLKWLFWAQMHILESFHAWGVWQGAEPRVVVVWNESFSLSVSLSLSLSLSLSVWKRFCLPLQVLFAGINKCFRSWRDDWNRFSQRPALMCALWAAWLRQRVACVWSEISSMLFYCTNGLINSHRETTGWERLVLQSFIHSHCLLTHSCTQSFYFYFIHLLIYLLHWHLHMSFDT